jgi:hypothetical protein
MAIEKYIHEFSEALSIACNKSFKTQRAPKKATTHKLGPWWTEELTILRERTNFLRSRYQRTRNNEELREKQKIQYFKEKAKYAAIIKRGESRSWKEYCNTTTSVNLWNEVYRLAAGKRNTSTQITILRKSDGTLTADIKKPYVSCWITSPRQTMNTTTMTTINMSELRPSNRLTRQTTEFTIEEIRNAVESMDNKQSARRRRNHRGHLQTNF